MRSGIEVFGVWIQGDPVALVNPHLAAPVCMSLARESLDIGPRLGWRLRIESRFLKMSLL